MNPTEFHFLYVVTFFSILIVLIKLLPKEEEKTMYAKHLWFKDESFTCGMAKRLFELGYEVSWSPNNEPRIVQYNQAPDMPHPRELMFSVVPVQNWREHNPIKRTLAL